MKRVTLGVFLAAALLPAQQVEKRVVLQRQDGTGNAIFFNDAVPPPPDGVKGGAVIRFMTSEMAGAPVKGAPYSARAVTDMTQVLADGNRIHTSTGSMLYRDGEGRTRREQSFGGLGPITPDEAIQMVFISDPVAGVSYVLNPELRTAHKSALPKPGSGTFMTSYGAAVTGMAVRHGTAGLALPPPPGAVSGEFSGAGPQTVMIRKRVEGGPPDVLTSATGMKHEAKTENLGTQMIEGVQATGTRNVMTIEAGAIGNDRPIEVVFEKWYSPELQVVVMTKNSDPRMGETTYKLTNISRSEPPHSMFEVPADYSVDEPK